MLKRICSILIALILIAALFACADPKADYVEPPVEKTQLASAQPTESAKPAESKPKIDSESAIWVEEIIPEVPKPADRWKPPEGSDVNLLKAMTEIYLMQVSRIDLVLENEPIHVVEDAQAVEGIVSLMANAPIQGGYSPMPWHTCSGFGLKFVFDDGTELMAELGLDNDMCRIGNWIRTYGPENDYNALPDLLTMLGLEDWPQEVYDAFSIYFEEYPVVNGKPDWRNL